MTLPACALSKAATAAAWTQSNAGGTAPEDFREGIGQGAALLPKSLYESQLARRLGTVP